MNSMFFVVCIVAIGCATAVITAYLKTRAHREDQDDDPGDSMAQIEALEERIRVLERIITENKYDLKREIDKL